MSQFKISVHHSKSQISFYHFSLVEISVFVFAISLLLKNEQRGIIVDTPFCLRCFLTLDHFHLIFWALGPFLFSSLIIGCQTHFLFKSSPFLSMVLVLVLVFLVYYLWAYLPWSNLS